MQLLKKYDLVDTWRIHNSFSKHYSFTKKSFFRYIQQCLDYIVVSKTQQESLPQPSILPSFCSDHSSILALYKCTQIYLGKNFWKFNGSLMQDKTSVLKLK